MAKWMEYFWLAAVLVLLGLFVYSMQYQPVGTQVVLGVALFIATLLYSYRRAQRRRGS